MSLSDFIIDVAFNRLRRFESQEIIYKQLFERELSNLGIKDKFYPINGAANYSLLYLILRIVIEQKPTRVLELGAGQSTLLLSSIMTTVLPDMSVTTLESNNFWADRIAAQAKGCSVVYSPLEPRNYMGNNFLGYNLSALSSTKYDLLIVDGPEGTSGISRASGLEVSLNNLSSDFVVIIDDAERLGERRLIRNLSTQLKARNTIFQRTTTRAIKWQVVFATDSYRSCLYM